MKLMPVNRLLLMLKILLNRIPATFGWDTHARYDIALSRIEEPCFGWLLRNPPSIRLGLVDVGLPRRVCCPALPRHPRPNLETPPPLARDAPDCRRRRRHRLHRRHPGHARSTPRHDLDLRPPLHSLHHLLPESAFATRRRPHLDAPHPAHSRPRPPGPDVIRTRLAIRPTPTRRYPADFPHRRLRLHVRPRRSKWPKPNPIRLANARPGAGP